MTQSDNRPALPVILVADALSVDAEGRLPLVRNVGNWWLPGGRVEAGESLTEAAVRETAEETGLRLDPTGIVRITQQIRQDSHVIFVTIRGRVSGDLVPPSNDPKIDGVRWASVEDAQDLLASLDVDLAKLLQTTPIAETAI